jgi:hypothetical protein
MKKAATVSGGDDLISVTQFSDSIILSADASADWAFENILSTTMFLIIELAAHGILLRGGITRGEIYHKENLAFGPAFIRAYRLEQAAGTPRIILDAEIEKTASWPDSMSEGEINGFLDKRIPRDYDGWRFVDYFSSAIEGEFDEVPEGLALHRKRLRKLVAKHTSEKDPSLISKFGWLDAKLKAIGE